MSKRKRSSGSGGKVCEEGGGDGGATLNCLQLGLKLHPDGAMLARTTRAKCPACNRSFKFYCPFCQLPVGAQVHHRAHHAGAAVARSVPAEGATGAGGGTVCVSNSNSPRRPDDSCLSKAGQGAKGTGSATAGVRGGIVGAGDTEGGAAAGAGPDAPAVSACGEGSAGDGGRPLQVSDAPRALALPLELHIIRHYAEKLKKSTAVHAKVVAPKHVSIFTFPEVPQYADEGATSTASFPAAGTLLLYPVEGAPSLKELASAGQLKDVKRLVVVDSTWMQAHRILSSANLAKLRRVRIGSYSTLFWRYQTGKPITHLATIEAIYFFYRVRTRSEECWCLSMFPFIRGACCRSTIRRFMVATTASTTTFCFISCFSTTSCR